MKSRHLYFPPLLTLPVLVRIGKVGGNQHSVDDQDLDLGRVRSTATKLRLSSFQQSLGKGLRRNEGEGEGQPKDLPLLPTFLPCPWVCYSASNLSTVNGQVLGKLGRTFARGHC